MCKFHGTQILHFVETYQREHHSAPSYRQIAAGVGIPSTDHVARDVRALARAGAIAFTPCRAKSIVVLQPTLPPAPELEMPQAKTEQVQEQPHNGRCQTCGILSAYRLCPECESGSPFIQYHILLAEDRFYQTAGPEAAAASCKTKSRSLHRTPAEGNLPSQPAKPVRHCHRERPCGRPPHVNAAGVKLCAKCDAPRVRYQSYCRKHVNEYRMEQYNLKKASRQARALREQAARIRAKYGLT